MATDKKKKTVKVGDLKPAKDAKGGFARNQQSAGRGQQNAGRQQNASRGSANSASRGLI
jgi:hypothetical protein